MDLSFSQKRNAKETEWIKSHLLKKSLMENVIFCTVAGLPISRTFLKLCWNVSQFVGAAVT